MDLGANVGLASVYLTRRHGFERIVAVAPLPENADLARLNLAMNNISAEVVQVALAPRSGPATFVGVNNHNLGRVAPKRGELPVTLVAVDETAPEPVRLVKLDIEGGEGPRPTANTAWLDTTRGLIVEVHPAEVDYPASPMRSATSTRSCSIRQEECTGTPRMVISPHAAWHHRRKRASLACHACRRRDTAIIVLVPQRQMVRAAALPSMKGRVVWCDEQHVVRQLPLRYRACAAYFRVVRRVQPRQTDKGYVVGGGFLVRSVASVSARLRMTNRLVIRVNSVALACDMSEARTLLIIEEARGHSWQEEFLRSILRPGDTYLDIGANGGGLTALACRIVHAHGAVFAVEPQPHFAALVRQTLELNDVEGRVFEVAAGDRDGVATLVVPMRRSGNVTLSMSGQGCRVSAAVNRIDDLVPGMGSRNVTLLKLDVEGHELAALKGADVLLRTSRPTILFKLNLDAQAAAEQSAGELLSWLEERGYTFAEVDDPGVQLRADGVELRGSRDLIAYPA